MTSGARAVLAAVFIWAAGSRLLDWQTSVAAIRGYRVLPPAAVHPAAEVVVVVELVLTAAVASGWATRPVAIVAGAVLAAFVAAVTASWVRGIPIRCGCPAGEVRGTGAYLWALVRDGALVAVAAALVWKPGNRPAVHDASPSTRTPGTNQSS